MSKERYDTGKKPRINVAECNGDLVIRGWREPEALVRGDDCDVDQTDDGLKITSNGRLRLLVPTDTTLSLNQVRGDVVVKDVAGEVEIHDVTGDAILVGLNDVRVDTVHNDLSAKRIEGTTRVDVVHGDVVARNVGGMLLDTAHGDLSASFVDGAVQLGQIMGDISLRGVTGDVAITKGHRDANLRGIGGRATVTDIRGDIRLRGGLTQGKHSFAASGDIILRWPEGELIDLAATASKIVNKLEFDEVTESKESLTGTMVGAQTHLTLDAKGQIVLKGIRVVDEKWEWEQAGEGEFDFAVDMESLGERISKQVNEHIARITTDLEDRFGPEFSQKMAEKIAKKAEWAATKAERAAEQAMRRAERSMRRSGRQVTRRARPTPATPPEKRTTSEEQLKILKMVEQGIITTEEASMLLEALEH